MPRAAKPWRWPERKGWYAWVKGSRRRLASLTEGESVARRRLRELLAEAERPAPASSPLTVGALLALYLADLRHRRDAGEVGAEARADVMRRLRGFVETEIDGGTIGDLEALSLRPHHVSAWLATRTTWGSSMRREGIAAAKSLYVWAETQGHIERSPIAKIPLPRRPPKRREAIPTPETAEKAMLAATAPGLRDFLMFVYETGCRPIEARILEASHVDFERRVAVLHQHKTAHKTGKPRVLYLTETALAIVSRLAELHPTGPLFRNARGQPWTRDATGKAIWRLRAKTGLGREMVAYGLRHLYITDGLAKGMAAPIMAELAGHSSVAMLATYSHVSERHDVLHEAAAKIREKDKKDSPQSESS